MSSLFLHYQKVEAIPQYGGTGKYGGISPEVSAIGFRDFVMKFVPKSAYSTSIGRFLRGTPILNKKGHKLTEMLLMRRLEELYSVRGLS